MYVPKQNTTCSESREKGPICHGLSFALFGHFFLSVGRITHEYEIIFSFNWMVFTCFKSWFRSSFCWYWFYSWTEIVSKVGNPMIRIVITIITRTKTITISNYHSHIFLTIIAYNNNHSINHSNNHKASPVETSLRPCHRVAWRRPHSVRAMWRIDSARSRTGVPGVPGVPQLDILEINWT